MTDTPTPPRQVPERPQTREVKHHETRLRLERSAAIIGAEPPTIDESRARAFIAAPGDDLLPDVLILISAIGYSGTGRQHCSHTPCWASYVSWPCSGGFPLEGAAPRPRATRSWRQPWPSPSIERLRCCAAR